MKRVEDFGLVTGKTQFLRDLDHDDCQHAVLVRSVVPHGDIRTVDVSAAIEMPGVHGVVVGTDLGLAPFRYYEPIPEPFARPLLAVDRVRMVGEPVAVVVAASQAQAVDAAELVDVDIEPLEPVLDPRSATEAGALFDGAHSNVVMGYDRGRVDDLFELASHRERGRYPNQRLCSAPMDPSGIIVRPDGDNRLDIWATGQGVHLIKEEIAKAIDHDPELIRVRSAAVGGGFGGRHSAPAELLIVAAVARHLGVPVRWDETRSENLATMVHGRAQDHTVEIGFDDDGLIVGLRVHNLADCGAYPHFGPLMPFMSRKLAGGPYRVPRVDYSWEAVVTTTNPVGPYRGAGQPEVTNGLERTMENAARSLGIDVLELRRRNLLTPEELPYETATNLTYDSGDYPAAMDRAAELIDYERRREEQAERRRKGDSVELGVGFACYVSSVDTSPEFAAVDIGTDGGLTLRCGTFNHGQSHATTIGELVANETGFGPADIVFVDGDTDATPHGAGTGGSRSAQMAGGAAVTAARALVARARRLAATLLEADPDDVVVMAGTDGRPGGLGVKGVPTSVIGWGDVAKAAEADGAPLSEATDYHGEGKSHPSGTHASVVEVDTETGAVTLLRHVVVDDCGTVLQPVVVEGQQHGGAAAGIGQALYESFEYDEAGNPRTVTFADYLLPSAAEMPSFITDTMDIPSPVSETGAKGIGENGAIASPTSVQNAVVDAVWARGVRHIDLPITPERVWTALQPEREG